MKKLKISMIAILAIFAVSCNVDDVENRPVVTAADAPVLSAPEEGNVYVLSPDNMDVLAERFVWSAANFGEGIIPTYTVEIDSVGDNFATPAIIGTTNGTLELAASNDVLNTALLAVGATPYESANFQVRVKASVGAEFIYSNVVEMIIKPYTTETPKLWVPGGYQSESGYGTDWTQATAPYLKSTGYGNSSFEGYVYIATDQVDEANGDGLKFSSQADWNGSNYGDDGTFSGVLSGTGSNILKSAGYYLVKADTSEFNATDNPNGMTYSFTPTQWGIIGNGTPGGWDNDTPMTYDPATKTWKVIATLTTQSAPNDGMKFRANNAWTLNFGDTGADGVLEYDGTNISTTAGTYLIELNLSDPRHYTYTMTAQ
jgi:hypothetical protein